MVLSLSESKRIHSHITHTGFGFATAIVFQNNLINMYVKCGSLLDAQRVFNDITQRDAISWYIIVAVCGRLIASEEGMDIYQSIMERGILSNVVTNAPVDMYAKCVRIHEARELFAKMPQKNVVLRTAMIVGYAQNGDLGEALRLFKCRKEIRSHGMR
ncbi:pentatricopeptide repeat-containing protein At3g29230 [Cryptomeria japonica]|uniref:pentatricopeptide repeat-containing protein At3g29230 n=1 Tax=Cryptomeria japonica TaxID=3369 RepID=UPI0025AD4EB1|nr:pentatricopeptide repeat-containing protein At3g29230 [Cryptomeria japonica]